jgi:signal transduction histidine kinase
MSRGSTDNLGRWRTRNGAYAFGAGVIAILVGLFSINLWHGHRDALAQAQRDVQNLAAILEQDISGKLLIIDYALVEMAAMVESALRAGDAATLTSDAEWLHRRRVQLPGASGIGVIDAQGIVTRATTIPNTPGLDISDREYFQRLRDNPGHGLYISLPYEARTEKGVYYFNLSRPIAAVDGTFGGIVVVTMELAKVSESFRSINIGDSGAVALWNWEGVRLAAYPPSLGPVGQVTGTSPMKCTAETPAVVFETRPSGPDMPIRIVACRRLSALPLIVGVGLGRDAVLSEWQRGAGLFAVALVLCAGAVLLFAHWIGRLHEAALGGAEARLRDAIESSGDSFALYNADDRLELWNSKFVEQTPHLKALEPLAGRKFEELLRANVPYLAAAQDDPEAFVAERLAQHGRPNGEPRVFAFKDGRWFMVHERRTSLGGLVSVRADVTALKRNEERLEQLADSLSAAKRQADEANHAKSKFLASMSHELRTPLNAIIGFSELIERQTSGNGSLERAIDYAHDIRRSGVHLLELINDILDMSKIEAGRQQFSDEPIDVQEMAETCTRMLASRAITGNVTVAIDVPVYLPQLRADHRSIKQVLLNLLSNAVKFTPAGGTVILQATLHSDGGVVLSVKDNGVGIPADQIGRVFEPFRQVDRKNYSKAEGTGLGLSICKGLLDAHGATIELVSEVGKGTTASAHFPPERTLRRPLTVAVR